MTWNYTDPLTIPRDEVRFLSGDTIVTDQLITDEEIAYARSKYPVAQLAAAFCLRSLAARCLRDVSFSMGDASISASDRAKAFNEQASILDPSGKTLGAALIVLPSFGGLTISGKDVLDSDTDAVQPFFKTGQWDNPEVSTESELES